MKKNSIMFIIAFLLLIIVGYAREKMYKKKEKEPVSPKVTPKADMVYWERWLALR